MCVCACVEQFVSVSSWPCLQFRPDNTSNIYLVSANLYFQGCGGRPCQASWLPKRPTRRVPQVVAAAWLAQLLPSVDSGGARVDSGAARVQSSYLSLILILILSYFILSYLILSYLILSYLILSDPIFSYLILSYLILSYLICFCFLLSHLISPHLISSHLILSHLISSSLISSHLILSYLISSYLLFSYPYLIRSPACYHPPCSTLTWVAVQGFLTQGSKHLLSDVQDSQA